MGKVPYRRNPTAEALAPVKGFDKIPRWVAKDPSFAKLDALAVKLLVYFSHVRGWTSDTTPWTTVEELTGRIGGNWRRTKRALVTLGALGVIRTETKRREKRFRLIYLSPHDHTLEQGTTGQTPLRSGNADAWGDRTATEPATKLDVPLDASVEGRSPSGEYAETADKPDRFGTQSWPKRQTSQDDDAPAWVTEPDAPAYQAGNVPGQDAELLDMSDQGAS